MEVKQLQSHLEAGLPMGTAPFPSTHNIATIMKKFLRQLPTPVLTFEMNDRFIAVNNLESKDEKIAELRKIVASLPECNRELLHCTLQLVSETSKLSDKNMMNAENLSKVIFPNLLWPKTIDPSDLSQFDDAKKANLVGQFMIEHCNELFVDNE